MMRRQVYMEKERADKLWRNIVRVKILNQAKVLEIAGLPNAERVSRFAGLISNDISIDSIEAGAAKEYFAILCPDINRHDESPMNSRLNYGYSMLVISLGFSTKKAPPERCLFLFPASKKLFHYHRRFKMNIIPAIIAFEIIRFFVFRVHWF